MTLDEEKIRRALEKSWSLETARQWTKDRPFDGQCNVTAAVVAEVIGGEILKTPWNERTAHFYNSIDGKTYDFTDAQFDTPIEYKDEQSSLEEASAGFTDSEFSTLRTAFLKHLNAE